MYILLLFMKEKKQFNCDMCDSCYESKLGLKIYILSIHENKKFGYAKCDILWLVISHR